MSASLTSLARTIEILLDEGAVEAWAKPRKVGTSQVEYVKSRLSALVDDLTVLGRHEDAVRALVERLEDPK